MLTCDRNVTKMSKGASSDTWTFIYQDTAAEPDGVTGLRLHRTLSSGSCWLSEEPKGFDAGDPNLRRVVGNNPLMYTDSSGLIAGASNSGTFGIASRSEGPSLHALQGDDLSGDFIFSRPWPLSHMPKGLYLNRRPRDAMEAYNWLSWIRYYAAHRVKEAQATIEYSNAEIGKITKYMNEQPLSRDQKDLVIKNVKDVAFTGEFLNDMAAYLLKFADKLGESAAGLAKGAGIRHEYLKRDAEKGGLYIRSWDGLGYIVQSNEKYKLDPTWWEKTIRAANNVFLRMNFNPQADRWLLIFSIVTRLDGRLHRELNKTLEELPRFI